jgi:hypothetical protein
MLPIFILLMMPTTPANSDATNLASFGAPKSYWTFQPAKAEHERRERPETQSEFQKRLDNAFDAERIYAETWAARWFPHDSTIASQPNQPGSIHFRYNDLDPWLNVPRPDARRGAAVIARGRN